MERTDKKVSYEPVSQRDRSGRPYTPETAAAELDAALSILRGRWKPLILFHLFDGGCMRLSDLERAIPAASQKMLIQHLRQLEVAGVVRRVVYPEVPPRVEYSLTGSGQALCPILDGLLVWAAGCRPAATETG
ncbi:transcriptional regulator [Allostella sp. ATCC 35155]|nr:transcriptional regulator [Stella sp. ATCC 35155]